MDRVKEAVEKTKDDVHRRIKDTICSIQVFGKSTSSTGEQIKSLPRLNGLAQDGLAQLELFRFNLDLLAPQLPNDDEVEAAQFLLESWKQDIQSLRVSLRNANLKVKDNQKKEAQEERELLLGAGAESTIRRHNLQAEIGMASAAESITESLRRTRQLMVQEVERNVSTLMTVEELLKKAESEFKGHHLLLMRTRNLLSTMQRQDVLERVILIIGLMLFSSAAVYVVSKRIGILKLQRKVTAAIKSGMDAVITPQQMHDEICDFSFAHSFIHFLNSSTRRFYGGRNNCIHIMCIIIIVVLDVFTEAEIRDGHENRTDARTYIIYLINHLSKGLL